MGSIIGWLARRADNVAVGLLAATFFSFFLQIFSRYVIGNPLGWTLEACLLAWLWLVFWSGAFTLRESDHVRFTIILDAMRPRVRRVFAVIASISIVAAFASALPATVDFVSFMKIEKTSLLKVPFDWVFSVYVIFSVAMIIRYGWRIVTLLRERP